MGSGPLLLFLHGLGGNRHAFDLQFAALSPDYRCVAWDAPGYGDSAPLEEMTFEKLAESVGSLIAELGQTPLAVIGHSFGGMIAQSWLHRGGQCEKLVLAQTSAVFGKPGSDWNADFLKARLEPLDQGATPADFAKPLIESMFVDTSKREAIESGIATMSSISSEQYRRVIQCLVTFDAADRLQNIDIPTLCLAAQQDKTAPPANMERMAATLPNADFVCLKNAGHLAYIEIPEQFNQAIQQFLEA